MKTKHVWWFFFSLLFIVSCVEDEMDPAFSIKTTGEVSLDSESGASAIFDFSSTCEWEANIDAEWITVSPTSGEGGEYKLLLTALEENNTEESRTATLTLTSGALNKKISIVQEAAAFIRLEQNEYTVDADGGDLVIKFTTNIVSEELVINVVTETPWLVENKLLTTSGQIGLTALSNMSAQTRTAHLYFFRRAGLEQDLLAMAIVSQEGLVDDTDYSKNKEVRVLQTASVGTGIPIVLMGDGFKDVDIEDGTYDKVMDKAYENLFTEEPIRSLKSYFNVYAVTAVSIDNSFGAGSQTAFSCKFEGGGSTFISGDNDAVINYVQCVESITLSDALAVVVLNSSAYAGTTYYGFLQDSKVVEFAIAYCPVIDNLESEYFRQVLTHEAIGHGLAKLGDEYGYEENGSIPSSEIDEIRSLQTLGWAQNVDFTNDTDRVLWNNFLSDSRYASEGLGIFEGGCTYAYGVYRPSEESMMNSNINGFNAPSRKAIYDRVMKQGAEMSSSYEEFVVFDTRYTNQLRPMFQTRTVGTEIPFARPQFTNVELLK